MYVVEAFKLVGNQKVTLAGHRVFVKMFGLRSLAYVAAAAGVVGAQTTITYEAESAILNGVTVGTSVTGYTGL